LFQLNKSNVNHVQLKTPLYIQSIHFNKINENAIVCNADLTNDDMFTISKEIFIKQAPLLDPLYFLTGYYKVNNKLLYKLPTIEDKFSAYAQNKICNVNNCSYIDACFLYLNTLLPDTFVNKVSFYGCYLGIKKNFKYNIADELEHIVNQPFFHKHKDTLFYVDDYSQYICGLHPNKQTPIEFISDDDNIPELVFETDDNTNTFLKKCAETTLTNDVEEIVETKEMIESQKEEFNDSDSDLNSDDMSHVSSRSSNTTISDIVMNENGVDDNEWETDEDDSNESDSIEDDESNNDSDDLYDEPVIYATIKRFPVNLICMEKCDGTLDRLALHNSLSEEEWFSALMQIIMSLLVYQTTFDLTHNDLHTNNIMYIKTDIPELIYIWNGIVYKVPTYGKIYKIIDYGRAIYRYKSLLFCSDSFQFKEDAYGQYNTEPYFNPSKPRIDPNPSFDLCRLACSVYDIMLDDLEVKLDTDEEILPENYPPVMRLIYEWCLDDNGKHIFYKQSGVERYMDFKLYKMIARKVHNHTPINQLNRPCFSKYATYESPIMYPNACNIDLLV
jgi:hypothetical protein